LRQNAQAPNNRNGAHKSLEITITDNGKGLPSENRDRLTEPYVTTRAKGTGLGLAIVKKIIEDHKGELQLGDNPGGGAIIRFNLAAEPGGVTSKLKKDPL
jgi:two-component system nitrogen regulation sensor histidine kinase NtrY